MHVNPNCTNSLLKSWEMGGGSFPPEDSTDDKLNLPFFMYMQAHEDVCHIHVDVYVSALLQVMLIWL